MPTSLSPRRATKAPPPAAPRRPRALWPLLVLIGLIAVLAVIVAALPASLAARFLPPGTAAQDFSGTLWHGSAGQISVGGRDMGAVEWHLHPASLLHMRLVADLHWVKGSFVLDGIANVGGGDLAASNLEGGGPIADLRDFGLAPGWSGAAAVHLQQLSANLSVTPPALTSATGEIDVANLTSARLAAGANLGSYALTFNNAALAPDTEANAVLADTGGPVALNATITLSPKTHTGLLSGTIKARDDAPEALRREIDQLAQLHARDAEGRIPVDLEFSF
jgi:Type II secretion system (T2SS), protein N